jgi:photosystem II stability/assembly factor-like uncharacterized protein
MPQLYVATNGLSLWKSDDLGERIARMGSGTNLYSGSQVWALASHRARPRHLLVGTDSGLFRLDRAEDRFTHLPSPMDRERLVTAIAQSPDDPDVIVVGTQPSALYRSDDGGRSWVALETAMKRFTTGGYYGASDKDAGGVKHWTRVTQVLFDPDDPARLWAGIEIDGAWTSGDGGKNWERVSAGLETDDIHGFALAGGNLLATTNAGLHISRDRGRTWQRRLIDSPWQYTRTLIERPDGSGVLLMTNGNGPPGTAGRLYRSRDGGAEWQEVKLPGKVESSLYFLSSHPADPSLIFAAATLGQLYRSRDGGESWVALSARLPEIRAMAWLPD